MDRERTPCTGTRFMAPLFFQLPRIRARIFLTRRRLMMMWIVIFALPLLLRVLRGLSSPERTLESGWFRGKTVGLKVRCFSYIKRYWISVSFFHPRRRESSSGCCSQWGFCCYKHIWPQCKVKFLDPLETGLYLPTSDIDVSSIGLRTPQLGLRALSRALSQKALLQNIQVIAKARVPIIKFVERKSEVAFDISFDAHNDLKLQSLSRQLFPSCLHYVYSGGIGSYALLAMLIAMLQTRPYLISIEDPQAPENDIGKNSYNYFQIRSAFSMAFSSLTNAKTILGLGSRRSILGTIIRPDRVLLERKGGSNGEMTFQLLLPGAGELVELQSGDPQMLCNWQMDDVEEPLPRGNGIEIHNGESSDRKRKSVSSPGEHKRKKRKAKYEENGLSKEKRERRKARLKENGSNNESGSGKKWKRKHKGNEDGYSSKNRNR
ncbi:unnamed protein product [Rhodiola kirilowii]